MKNVNEILEKADVIAKDMVEQMCKNWTIQEFTPAHAIGYCYGSIIATLIREEINSNPKLKIKI